MEKNRRYGSKRGDHTRRKMTRPGGRLQIRSTWSGGMRIMMSDLFRMKEGVEGGRPGIDIS